MTTPYTHTLIAIYTHTIYHMHMLICPPYIYDAYLPYVSWWVYMHMLAIETCITNKKWNENETINQPFIAIIHSSSSTLYMPIPPYIHPFTYLYLSSINHSPTRYTYMDGLALTSWIVIGAVPSSFALLFQLVDLLMVLFGTIIYPTRVIGSLMYWHVMCDMMAMIERVSRRVSRVWKLCSSHVSHH